MTLASTINQPATKEMELRSQVPDAHNCVPPQDTELPENFTSACNCEKGMNDLHCEVNPKGFCKNGASYACYQGYVTVEEYWKNQDSLSCTAAWAYLAHDCYSKID